ncbi:MAG: hypothetical protein EOO10_06155 [Chitinophagaceae bacterium]|nr:MAG: hypothetical protein EOO10_06155 [Chitinophagaceae bacterium]
MKKENVPQDRSALAKLTKELSYAVDENGNYTTTLSNGWEVKAEALDIAWDDIKQRIADARAKVDRGEASPILFFMELRLMDPGIIAGYTGFWQWQIKRHMKQVVFAKLSEKKLQKYADAFNVSLAQLKSMNVDED